MKTILNLGSGQEDVPRGLALDGAEVVCVDLVEPADVIADVRQLPFEDEYADVVYASHLLEHFEEHEVIPALKEWRRVLKPGGRILIEVPDIQSASVLIASNGIDAVLYRAGNGELIRGQDLLFGLARYLREFGEPMRHKVAFDGRKLAHCMAMAGFVDGNVQQRPELFNLTGDARK